MTPSLFLNFVATVATLWLLGSRAVNVALDVQDGEHVRHWGPQALAIVLFLVVLLGAIWS